MSTLGWAFWIFVFVYFFNPSDAYAPVGGGVDDLCDDYEPRSLFSDEDEDINEGVFH